MKTDRDLIDFLQSNKKDNMQTCVKISIGYYDLDLNAMYIGGGQMPFLVCEVPDEYRDYFMNKPVPTPKFNVGQKVNVEVLQNNKRIVLEATIEKIYIEDNGGFSEDRFKNTYLVNYALDNSFIRSVVEEKEVLTKENKYYAIYR